MYIFRKSLDELFPLFFSNLEDSIPSVRQGGAVAIANVVRAYGMYNVIAVVQFVSWTVMMSIILQVLKWKTKFLVF